MAAKKIPAMTNIAPTRSYCAFMLRFPAKVTGELFLTISVDTTTGTTTRRTNDSSFHKIGSSFVEEDGV
jgi:hypothetical protein